MLKRVVISVILHIVFSIGNPRVNPLISFWRYGIGRVVTNDCVLFSIVPFWLSIIRTTGKACTTEYTYSFEAPETISCIVLVFVCYFDIFPVVLYSSHFSTQWIISYCLYYWIFFLFEPFILPILGPIFCIQ